MASEGRHRPSWIEVSRSALAHNLEVLRDVSGGQAICAVVKANAYGHGATLVAAMLEDLGVDMLGVAMVDEGVELREHGVRTPILVLAEADEAALDLALHVDLTLTIGSAEGARAVVEAASRLGGHYDVHLKVDTGMRRQGVLADQAQSVAQILTDSPHLTLRGLSTHFSVADGADTSARSFTEAQVGEFESVRGALREAGITPDVIHLSNSAALIAGTGGSSTMVRPGLALYGYAPAGWLAEALERRGLDLRPVGMVRAKVTAVRHAHAGDRPSYGRHRALAHDAVVATIPFGYADGFPRRMFDGGAEVLIGGARYPLAGMVTMDQIVVDCATASVHVGDDVVLLGRDGDQVISADDWATWGGTVSWEVLAGLRPRVARYAVD